MSERGSWVTQFIYCETCKASLRTLLEKEGALKLPREKYFNATDIYDGAIFAGKIGGLYQHEEMHDLDAFVSRLGRVICHPLTVVGISDGRDNSVFVLRAIPSPSPMDPAQR